MARLIICIIVFLSILSFPPRSAALNEGTDRPSDAMVSSQVRHLNEIKIVLGGIVESKSGAAITKTENGIVHDWTAGTNTIAGQFGKSAEDGIWRLTEIESSLDSTQKKISFRALTTSFNSNGVRSKTSCEGKIAETIQCVTATRKFCDRFKNESKKQSDVVGLDMKNSTSIQSLKTLGTQCSNYAEFLNATINPNRTLNDSERTERDSIVSADLNAMNVVKNSLKRGDLKGAKLKGLSDIWNREDNVGASSTGMKERAERLSDIGKDFRALSDLAVLCSETEFSATDQSWDLKSGQNLRRARTVK